MKIQFDFFNKTRIPTFVLCKPDKERIEVISSATNKELELNLIGLSNFSFQLAKLNNDVVYDKIEVRKKVEVEGYGVFEIVDISIDNDGIAEYKNVSCKSSEYDFAKRSLTEFEGTYSFYNPLNPEKSLLTELLTYVPNWSIGEIDSSLWEVYRTFNIADMSIYDFLLNEVAKSYECIFVFDTFNNTINAYHYKNLIKETNVYMSYDNLVKQLKRDIKSEDLISCLDVRGCDDVTIRGVNPTGDNKIYNFQYYLDKSKEWLKDSTIDKIIAWQEKIKSKQAEYNQLTIDIRSKIEINTRLESQLYDLEKEKTSLEDIKSSRIAGGLDLGDINSQIASKQAEINAKKTEISNNKSLLEALKTQKKVINDLLKFENNFTAEEVKELNVIIVGATYIDDTFIYTDIMTDAEKQDVSLDLYNHAVDVLERNSIPRIEFSLDSVNYFGIKEFEPFIRETELGKQFTLEISRGVCAYPILQGITLNFDDPTKLNLKFSNRLRMDNSILGSYEDIILGANKTNISVNFDGYKWDKGEQANSIVNQYISNALDLVNQSIISASGQCPEITSSGVRGIKKNKDGTIDPKQYLMTNNVLAFSKDGFQTSEMAIGEITLPDGKKSYGIIADAIVGRIIIGEQLLIQNQMATFKVTGDKVYIKGADLIVTDALGNEEVLEEALKNSGSKVYYQATPPTDMKQGDLWYDTDDGNTSYVYKDGSWQNASDKDIEKALNSANSANEKIDGVLTNGEINAGKITGQILAGKNNIFSVDNANTRALLMNETGILIANSKTGSSWNWRTAISADGVVAESIKAGTISGVTIMGSTIIGGNINDVHSVISPIEPFSIKRGVNKAFEVWTNGMGGSTYMKMYGINNEEKLRFDAGGTFCNINGKDTRLSISTDGDGTDGYKGYMELRAQCGIKLEGFNYQAFNITKNYLEIGDPFKETYIDGSDVYISGVTRASNLTAGKISSPQISELEVRNLELENSLIKQGMNQSELEVVLMEKGVL